MLVRLLSLLAVLLLLASGGPARAQAPAIAPVAAPPSPAAARVDAAKGTIDQVQATLARRDDLDDGALTSLRGELDPLPGQMNAVGSEIAPQIEAAKAQLAQLGPKPGPHDPPEPAAVSAERSQQDELFAKLDATAKRARVIAVQASQLSDTINAQIRARFAKALLARSYSLASPALWKAVFRELPSDRRAISTLTTDWATASWIKLSEWQRFAFAALLASVALAYWPVWRIACHVRSRREDFTPGPLRKALAALRVTSATAAVPVLAILTVDALVVLFDLPTQFYPVGRALTIGVAVVAVMTGLMRGILAPKSPKWRLVPISNAGAKILYHLAISVSSLLALQKIVEAVNEVTAVALPTAVATRGLGALAVVAAMLVQTRKGFLARRAGQDQAPTVQAEHWTVILRLVGWTLMVVLLLSALSGYVAFAAFVVEQMVALAGTIALVYLLLAVTENGIPRVVHPASLLGRALTAATGLKPHNFDQIAILLSGITKLALYLTAILLILAPWRIASGDMLATVEAAFFGFKIGDLTLSISTLIVAIALFAIVVGATRALQRWLETKYLPHTKLDVGLQNSIKTSLGYIGTTLALGLALAHLGLGFERLTIIAGGLSVGIGLGLQTITNNFVSGLILLWERAVRVGDRVTVGNEQGYVRRINVRATEIETFDRALVVMPNSSLVTGVVKNWVRNDRIGRISLPFMLPVVTDPEAVRSMLIDAGKSHDLVLAIPGPQVFFTTLTDTQIHLELVCYVEDVESAVRVTSDLLFVIYAGLKDLGLMAPAAAASVTNPALEKLDAWLTAAMDKANRPATAEDNPPG